MSIERDFAITTLSLKIKLAVFAALVAVLVVMFVPLIGEIPIGGIIQSLEQLKSALHSG